MDPNTAWVELVRWASMMIEDPVADGETLVAANRVLALRDWLSSGGFAPVWKVGEL